MKTVTKVLLFGLACASVTNVSCKWDNAPLAFAACATRGQYVAPRNHGLHPPKLVLAATFTKMATTGLLRETNNSALTVGKNTLKSLGGSTLASLLLFIANTQGENGLLSTLNRAAVMPTNKASKIAHSRVTMVISAILKSTAALTYLAGQNNWNPIKGLRPSALKALLTKQYSTTEQLEFLLNTLVPLWAAGGECNLADWTSFDFPPSDSFDGGPRPWGGSGAPQSKAPRTGGGQGRGHRSQGHDDLYGGDSDEGSEVDHDFPSGVPGSRQHGQPGPSPYGYAAPGSGRSAHGPSGFPGGHGPYTDI